MEDDCYVQITGKTGAEDDVVDDAYVEITEEVELRQLRLYDYLGESALVKEKR